MWGFVLALHFTLVFDGDHTEPFMIVQPERADQPAAAVQITCSADIHRELIKGGAAPLPRSFRAPTLHQADSVQSVRPDHADTVSTQPQRRGSSVCYVVCVESQVVISTCCISMVTSRTINMFI